MNLIPKKSAKYDLPLEAGLEIVAPVITVITLMSSGHPTVVIRSSGHHFANLHVVIRSSGHHFANYIGHHFQRTLELISIPTQTVQHIQFCFHLFNICVLDPSRVQHILDPSRVVNICNYVFPCVLEFNI